MILVTGCPRSGTKSMWKALSDAGLKVGHEKLERDGVVSWRHLFPESGQYMRYDKTIAIIREPCAVVGSLTTIMDRNKNYMLQKLQLKPSGNQITDLFRCYYYWTKIAVARADYSFHIESVPVLTLREITGLKNHISVPHIHQRSHDNIEAEDLKLADNVLFSRMHSDPIWSVYGW